jgi:hypothetical protein
MLLDSLEEKLDLASVVIEFGNYYWADSQLAGHIADSIGQYP